MFRINRSINRIMKLKQVSYSQLGYTEVHHLQEWIANQPDALGEELLVIQKEFAGFEDTRERLDLLAIDKKGGLVVIENKLDDSGKDVVWQSLKYASYCSTLTNSQIAEIFQQYLDKQAPNQDARALICEFLDEMNFDGLVLNTGNDQRIIMVAAQFRKEVTSTALWLLSHRIQLKCFKATPFQDGQDEYLTIEQVIPFPNAEEHMIRMSEKEDQEQEQVRVQAASSQKNIDFWHQALEALHDAGVTLYDNVSPRRDHWLNVGSGLGGVQYSMVINKDEARVNFQLDRTSKEENKLLFDELQQRRAQLDTAFGAPLSWRRMDSKKVSIIEFGAPFETHQRENWPAVIDWLVSKIRTLEQVFDPEIPRLRAALQQQKSAPAGSPELDAETQQSDQP